MFENFKAGESRLNIVENLWSVNQNRDLINRDFSRYLKTFEDCSMKETEFMNILKAGRVLDVACGEGGFVSDCLEKGIDAYGADLAFAKSENIERLSGDNKFNGELKSRVIASEATALPFLDESFKVIMNQAGAFSYVNNPAEIVDMLNEQLRVLSDKGKIIINPIEIYVGGFCPVNCVNIIVDKDKKLSEEKLEAINVAFSDAINSLTQRGDISVEIREKLDDSMDMGVMYGMAVITKKSSKK